MSNVGKVYKGDIGVLIEVETGVDCSGAATKQLLCFKPDGTTKTWTATVKVGDTSVLQYTTISGDFDVDGQYELQAKCIWATGETLFGSTAAFRVYPLYD